MYIAFKDSWAFTIREKLSYVADLKENNALIFHYATGHLLEGFQSDLFHLLQNRLEKEEF